MNESAQAYLTEEVPLIAEAIARRVRPCVLGQSEPCSDDDIPIGSSKFCGKPDVPTGFEWPNTDDGPCWFLSQINLAELSDFETDVEIPKNGLISFFYHDAGGPAGPQSQLLYFATDDLHRIAPVPDTRWGDDFQSRHLFSRRLTLTQGYCLPDTSELGLSNDELGKYQDLDDIVDEFNDCFAYGTHQFFGLPRYLQQRMPPNHQLIASFGECSDRILYFLPESAVTTLESSRLRVLYECT